MEFNIDSLDGEDWTRFWIQIADDDVYPTIGSRLSNDGGGIQFTWREWEWLQKTFLRKYRIKNNRRG